MNVRRSLPRAGEERKGFAEFLLIEVRAVLELDLAELLGDQLHVVEERVHRLLAGDFFGGAQDLTGDTPHSGFPSFSADGKRMVYRVWGENDYGLRILNLEDRSVQLLTTEPDNLPGWSPDGSRVVFTRRQADGNYDVFTIRPDGSDLRRLTNSSAVDGHAVWSTDGKHILWNSGMHGWKDEAAL